MKHLFLILISGLMFCFENTMSQREKELTHELIFRLGHKSIKHLMLHQGELREIGKRIDHVPPLQFFSYIVINPELRTSLKLLLNRVLTRTNFINGAKSKLIDQKKSGKLEKDLEGFSNYVQKNYDQLLDHTRNNNWNEFINYLAQ